MNASERATTVLTVDLGAVAANWRRLRDRSQPAACAAVVKADAYGLGADQVAPALAAAGCDTFFVATIDEGIALRARLPKASILVLCGPLRGTEADFVAHRLVPVLNSLEQCGLWRSFGAARGEIPPAALHIDTGMTRLGLDEAEFLRLMGESARLDGIRPVLAMSHMACADDRDAALNSRQRDTFARISSRLPTGVPRSLAASSAIFLGRDFHFDLVRPGAALYGVNPVPGQPNPMRQTVRLDGKILQIRDVDTPMTVGYGATHSVLGKGRIATVAVGYADGYLRSLGSRGHGFVGGKRVPVVGRISMDLVTFDVSGLPEDAVRPGRMIELVGPSHDVDALAVEAGTIGYEILTSLGRRALRRYVGATVADAAGDAA